MSATSQVIEQTTTAPVIEQTATTPQVTEQTQNLSKKQKNKQQQQQNQKQQNQTPSKKQQKKNNKDNDAQPEKTPEEILEEMTNAVSIAGKQFSKTAEDEKFFVGNMKDVDNDGKYEVPFEIMELTAKKFRENSPDTALLLVSVCDAFARVYVDIPKSRPELIGKDWVNSLSLGGTEKKLEEGESSLKYRDVIIGEAFAFLKKTGLLKEEADEVIYSFDD